jgi:hypothetical protein
MLSSRGAQAYCLECPVVPGAARKVEDASALRMLAKLVGLD